MGTCLPKTLQATGKQGYEHRPQLDSRNRVGFLKMKIRRRGSPVSDRDPPTWGSDERAHVEVGILSPYVNGDWGQDAGMRATSSHGPLRPRRTHKVVSLGLI